MKVDRGEGELFFPASPKCWCHINLQTARYMWAGLTRVRSQESSRCSEWSSRECVSLRWRDRNRVHVAAVHLYLPLCHLKLVCWKMGAYSFHCMEWADALSRKNPDPQMHLIVNTDWTLARLLPPQQACLYISIDSCRVKKKQRRGVTTLYLCPGQGTVIGVHVGLGFWPISGWFGSAEVGWSMLSMLLSIRNASSVVGYYRDCSEPVSSFCRVWVHNKWDQESLVSCAWLSAQANQLFWKVEVF